MKTQADPAFVEAVSVPSDRGRVDNRARSDNNRFARDTRDTIERRDLLIHGTLMPIQLRNIRLALDQPESDLPAILARRLRVSVEAIRTYAVVRRSLDARRKDDIHFIYQVELGLDEPPAAEQRRIHRLRRNDVAWLPPAENSEPTCGDRSMHHRPIIIGFGPGGMFAALRLAQFGYRPIVLERGREVRRRHRDIMQRFYKDREFDPESNLLFGEGGAGTYSDGKLYTRVNDPLCRTVLEQFYQHGADPDILIDSRPHIGSDRLPTICQRIRKKIEALGGEVRFECQISDIDIVDGALDRLHLRGADQALHAGPTILAIGHSARDTIRMLCGHGIAIVPKPFQIGVRIEHPQSMVDQWQYGAAAGHARLGPAEYHMVAKRTAGDGDVFSFCMCPGGMILPTNESDGLIATNGASRAGRSSPFANSGFVLSMDPAALGLSNTSEGALKGLAYLEGWERMAFDSTGGSYRLPVQRMSDFLEQRPSDGTIDVSYPLGAKWTDVASLLPETVTEALRRALPILGHRYDGFCAAEGLISAPETRASSPVRILRDPATRVAIGCDRLYPVGEGAGYAGGIVSAAVDGIKSANAIINTYAQPS